MSSSFTNLDVLLGNVKSNKMFLLYHLQNTSKQKYHFIKSNYDQRVFRPSEMLVNKNNRSQIQMNYPISKSTTVGG